MICKFYWAYFLSGASCIISMAFSASTSIPPPPSLSVPVWSLSCPLSSTISALENKYESIQTTTTTTKTSDDVTSMNIITFATPVSVAPPKLWAMSLYTNTLTKRAFEDSNIGILQLLKPNQSNLIPILGKRSGYELDFSKRTECRKLGFEWKTSQEISQVFSENPSSNNKFMFDILPNCASYIFLRRRHEDSFVRAGDHDVSLCEVVGTGMWDSQNNNLIIFGDDSTPSGPMDQNNVLYTGRLRKEGII